MGLFFADLTARVFTSRIEKLAERLAATPLRNFWISLDSCIPAVHEKMRGLSGVVDGIEKALPIFHAAGIYPSANLGINRCVGGEQTRGLKPGPYTDRKAYLDVFYHSYRDALDRFYRLVKDLGFTIVNTCYPMSISDQEKESGLSAVYAATAEEDVVRFTGDEKSVLFKALFDTILHHRDNLRIFSPLTSIYRLYQAYGGNDSGSPAFGCRGGVDFFFIDSADGNAYPCGYRGNENLGKFWQLNLNKLKPKKDCLRCDWECFRDPSELSAPFLQALNAPIKLMRNMALDPVYRRLWLEDLKYYRLCDFFDGRKPPKKEQLQYVGNILAPFKASGRKSACSPLSL